MRVLHVLAAAEYSGAEVMLRQAAPDMSAAGVRTEILTTTDVPGAYEHLFAAAGVPIRSLAFSRSPLFAIRFWKLIRSDGYDVVHVHTERASFWLELAARLAGAPKVARTVHSSFQFGGLLRFRRLVQRQIAWRALGVRHVFVSSDVAQNEQARFGTRGRLEHAAASSVTATSSRR
jgi:hypothetical protein